MIIYLDESYDHDHQYLLFGALFNPHQKFLHKNISDIKKKHNFYSKDGKLREIKYNYVTDNTRLLIAKRLIDIFFESTSWFRAIVIEEKIVDLGRFGRKWEPEKIKRARLYKKFAELLIAHNTENVFNAKLFVDELTRCQGDKFIEILKQEFCLPFGKHSSSSEIPTLKDIREIHSHIEEYQVNQVGDILMGCILNNLRPAQKQQKMELRNHLIKKLGVPNLLPEFWKYYSKNYVETNWPKFNIWYWKPSENNETQDGNYVNGSQS